MLDATRLSKMGRSTAATIVVLALCMLAQPGAAQQAGWRAHELQASMITLPSSDPGVLAALPCGSCAALSWLTTNGTRYEIGGEETAITLAEMRRLFADNPKANVVVTLTKDRRTVERVWISSPLTLAQ
jgi:hypothetical protein